MTRMMRATVAGTLLVASLAVGSGTAHAEAPDGNGLLRLAHLSPDTPAVDVYVDAVADPASRIMLPGVDYGTVSDYQDVPAGTYTVSMRTAGSSPDTPAVLSTTVDVDADTARTVAGVGEFAELGLEIIDDSLAAPTSGQARVRVLAAASSAETVDVTVPDGPTVASRLAFAATGDYVDVPAGSTTLRVSAGGGGPTDLPVDLTAGAVYSVLVLSGAQGALTVQPVLDAAGSGVVPVGGVETGAGGTAGPDVPVGMFAALALVLAGAAVFLTSAGRSRPRHLRRP